MQQLHPTLTAYNVPFAVEIVGNLNVQAMILALADLTSRHDVLRTSFKMTERGLYQCVSPSACDVSFTDLSDLMEANREAALSQQLDGLLYHVFDLSSDSPLIAQIIRKNRDTYILGFVVHHIAADQWSMPILFRELGELYRARATETLPNLHELSVQYADYAVWQRKCFGDGLFADQMEYWKNKLSGAGGLDLPFDHPRPAVQSFAGAWYPFAIGDDISQKLKRLAYSERATPFMLLVAAFNVLLRRYANADDIVIGAPLANRTNGETEELIGFFTNTIALRTDLSDNPTFRDLLQRVRSNVLEAHRNQEVPFEWLVKELGSTRDPSKNPIFQVQLTYQDEQLSIKPLHGIDSICRIPFNPKTSKFDIVLSLTSHERSLSANIEYCTELFDRETIARIARNFVDLLASVVSQPDARIDALPMLSASEAEILSVWNATKQEGQTSGLLHVLLQKQAAESPESTALVFGSETMSYAELNATSNRLARYLRELGVDRGTLVALLLPRSLGLAVGIAAILKAGAGYVALDPDYPTERLAGMLDDAGALVLLTSTDVDLDLDFVGKRVVKLDDAEVRAALGGKSSSDLPEVASSPSDPAYVVYTSGSTGKPKGVLLQHRAIVNMIEWQHTCLLGERRAKTLQFASPSFDLVASELFSTWRCGGTLYFIDSSVQRDPIALSDVLSECQIERLFLPFFAFQSIAEVIVADSGGRSWALREVLTSGEALRWSPTLDAFVALNPECRLINQYGPSETHCVSAHEVVAPEALPPIGKPIWNTQIYILNDDLRPKPIGATGEIYVGGAAVGWGYVNNPRATADRFLPNPFSEESPLLYKTGDLGRFRADGTIQFAGRRDRQVKVRGHRIEPEEIESILIQHDAILDCAIGANKGDDGNLYLVAYLVLREQSELDDVRRHLVDRLPEAMVPSQIVSVSCLPVGPNGKLDRKALPHIERTRAAEIPLVPPRTDVERAVCSMWSNVLGIDAIGVRDNFFALGGHSILATRLALQMGNYFDIKVPVIALFQSPTVEELALCIDDLLKRLASPSNAIARQRRWD